MLRYRCVKSYNKRWSGGMADPKDEEEVDEAGCVLCETANGDLEGGSAEVDWKSLNGSDLPSRDIDVARSLAEEDIGRDAPGDVSQVGFT